MATTRELLTLEGHTESVESVAYSKSGDQIITCGGDMMARTWEAKSGREILKLRKHFNDRTYNSVFICADGEHVITLEPSNTVNVLDLATGQITTIPGSTGLFSPRWSSDGIHMAAINAAAELTILDLGGRSVFTLSGRKVGFPTWSRGGDFVYFQDRTDARVPTRILRLSVPGRKLETVVQLEGIGRLPLGTFASWSGLAPDDAPLLSRDISGQEIYSVRW